MDKETFDNYIKAGRIASKVLNESKKLIVSGASVLEVVEITEQSLMDNGAELACPTTISINDIAAHYTPLKGDSTKIGQKDVVKLDLTAMIGGCIADTATTVSLDPDYEGMNNAVKSALRKALKMATPGTKAGEIGAQIESEIISHGYRPIINLSGHILSSYELHSGFSIPNIKTGTNDILEEDMVLAIEPFATDGYGMVKEISKIQIYRYLEKRPTRLDAARRLLYLAKTKYHAMPFTPRWITDINGMMMDSALRQLSAMNALYAYPVLKEKAGGMVTQAEHTVIVRDKPIVTTKVE
ncbi:MAG: type II methionyl aminopeptidase [archaeon]|nr:type II methionyl aminopeptidase [archaeon]